MTALSDLRYRPEWVRPLDWLALPNIEPPTEGIAALIAVDPDGIGNLVSLKMTITGAATYTVDWGDGSAAEAINSAATATHEYAWADVANVTSEGWRQAVLTVYPATGGAFATINLAAPVASGVRNTGWTSPLADLLCSASAVTSVLVTDPAARGGISSRLRSAQFRSNAPNIAFFPRLQSCAQLKALTMPALTAPVTATTDVLAKTHLPQVPTGLAYLSTLSRAYFEGVAPSDVSLDFGGRACELTYFAYLANGIRSLTITGRASGGTAYLLYDSPSIERVSINSVIGLLSAAFYGCETLLSLAIGNAAGITGTLNAVNGCTALESLILTGLTIGISVANCNLGAAALNAFFTSLGTAAGAQTLTITGNPGAGTCDTSIATAKGFTVVN